ncbi:hypothetical protein HPB50_026271 [Hyalomma asiaticum]|uniref:Uncharacterized protein n=1 Tax=Hyalomma asiaticum TaxID=266040 RepID=A0ACB7SLJ6_HYAAI|nr:hypothetical protein HPB50_026271 [Hyalomma asiaticum]
MAAACSKEAPASPLSMQMSNRTIDEGLDFGHGDGASAESSTSMRGAAKRLADEPEAGEDGEQSPPSKQARCDSSGAFSSPDNAHAFSSDLPSSLGDAAYFQDDHTVDSFGEQSLSASGNEAAAAAGPQPGNGDRPAVLSFDILDEVGQGDEEDVNGEDSANNGCSGEPGEAEVSDSDISDDEIEAMLEAGMRSPGKQEVEDDDDVAHELKEKVILKGPSGKTAGLAGRIPTAKVESVKESQKEQSLDALAFRRYCEAVFDFDTIQLRKFKTWAGRRKHKKKLKQMQRPMLPESTKLIMCSLPPTSDTSQITSGHSKREFIMNPSGKSNVCILHEYVQHAMRTQPQYKFGELAKAALAVLIPQMRDTNQKNEKGEDTTQDVAFFDNIKVEDPRVNELCAKTGQLSPYQILLECLKRNYGMGDTEIKQEMRNMKHQRNEFMMSVGKHSANALHPHVNSWGSLLRLYGKGSCKTLKEKKEEEQRITELQSKASANRPNLCILNKLKEEMLKIKQRREAVKPIGKFVPQEVDFPSLWSSDLKVLDI